jgi:hypothetical protein
MMRIFLIFVMTFFAGGICCAQISQPSKTGIVKISIVSLPYYSVEESDNNTEKYTFFLKGKNSVDKIPYERRIPQKNAIGDTTFHIDEYEIHVPPGIYKIVFKNYKNYKLPNFEVNPGSTVHFLIPQYRFAAEENCLNGQRGIPLHGGDDAEEREKRLRHAKRLSTEVFVLYRPFEAAVQYCGRERTGNVVHYKSARMYYKNIFIDADDLLLNKDTMIVEAKGSNEFPVEYQINGGEFEKKQELVLKLNDK